MAPATSSRRFCAGAVSGDKQGEAERADQRTDRQVHQKHPVPAQRAGEHATRKHADAAAAGANEAVDAHRLGAFAGFAEQIHDQRQRNCRHRRTAEALHRSCNDQQPLGTGERAHQRRRGEEGRAEQEPAALAVEVAEPPAEQQEAAVRDHISVHHPDQRRVAEAQVGLDRGQGDVDDRGVDHDHELARAQQVEGEPAFALGHHSEASSLSIRALVPFSRLPASS